MSHKDTLHQVTVGMNNEKKWGGGADTRNQTVPDTVKRKKRDEENVKQCSQTTPARTPEQLQSVRPSKLGQELLFLHDDALKVLQRTNRASMSLTLT